MIMKTPSSVYLSIGSNLGEKITNLNNAIALLEKKGIELIQISSIYRTPPWGFASNNSFFNLMVEVKTDLKPQILLTQIKEIEVDLGRESSASFNLKRNYSDRIIDIDIIDYKGLTYRKENLCIPHNKMIERLFVLIPLKDLNETYVHPELNKEIAVLIDECKDSSILMKVTH